MRDLSGEGAVGPTQALGELCRHRARDATVFDERPKRLWPDDEDPHLRLRPYRRSAGTDVKHGHLADEVTGTNGGDGLPVDEDLCVAVDDHERFLAGDAFASEALTRTDVDLVDKRGKRCEDAVALATQARHAPECLDDGV